MSEAKTSFSFSKLPVCGIKFPSNPLLGAAVNYAQAQVSPTAVNHSLRCAAYSLIGIRKVAEADKELVVLACIMLDLGWATTSSLTSEDKRFEVDGANVTRAWIREHLPEWSERQIQLVWDSIALHSTPSIAPYKETEVAASHWGITADFFGPNLPGVS